MGIAYKRNFLAVVAAITIPFCAEASGMDWSKLSERERTFLRAVLSGDEAKAVEYAQVAGINVNAMGGAPLSTWFYRAGKPDSGRSMPYNLVIQRIVFERFKQNPNPPGVEPASTSLGFFCSHAPVSEDMQVVVRGTPEQKKALAERQAEARKPYLAAMAAHFDALLRYGLRDKGIIAEIFKGCVFRSASPLDAVYYDTVLSRMLRAGADLNAEAVGGERPIQFAVKALNPVLAERLLADGAEVRFPVRHSGFDKPSPNERCGPRRDRSLYVYVFKWTRVSGETEARVIRLVSALAKAGLSPLTKYGYPDDKGGSQCHYQSFYDAIIDTGNLAYARSVKEAGETAARETPPTARRAQAEARAAQGAAAVNPPPGTQQAPSLGAWTIATGSGGRPVAIGKTTGAESPLRELRIECVAGGRLEYVPVAANGSPVKSVWLHGTDDVMTELPAANGRFGGPAAAQLSKQFLATETSARQSGAGDQWDFELTIDVNRSGAMIPAQGFSRMRAHLLANCKS